MHQGVKFTIVAGGLAVALALGAAIGAASADQPRMHNALNDLRAARAELAAALADKGGHRVKALADVDAAIAEVQAGIDYDRTH